MGEVLPMAADLVLYYRFYKLLGSRGWVLPLVLHVRLLLLQSFSVVSNVNSFRGLWFHDDLNIRSPIVLEFKCDDLCGFSTMWESRYLSESQYMKLIFNPSFLSFGSNQMWLMFKHEQKILFSVSCQCSNLKSKQGKVTQKLERYQIRSKKKPNQSFRK